MLKNNKGLQPNANQSADPQGQSIINAQTKPSYHDATPINNCEQYQIHPVDIEAIATAIGLNVSMSPEDLGLSFLIIGPVRKTNYKLIAIVNQPDSYTTRYNIALAIAYNLIKTTDYDVLIRTNGPVFAYHGRIDLDDEKKAEDLAGELLIPGLMLNAAVKTFDGKDLITELKHAFQAPEEVIRRRLITTGYIELEA